MPFKLIESQCSCDICSSMCQAPCCGTPDDMQKLIDAGYIDRLMLDDWPDGETLIKPALKGHEGYYAPFETKTVDGCTFWENGLCQLHALKLKPTVGRCVQHDTDNEYHNNLKNHINKSWSTKKAKKMIEKYKEFFKK